jgi:hypothetical protein
MADQAIAIAKRLPAKAVEKRNDNAPVGDANTRANGLEQVRNEERNSA